MNKKYEDIFMKNERLGVLKEYFDDNGSSIVKRTVITPITEKWQIREVALINILNESYRLKNKVIALNVIDHIKRTEQIDEMIILVNEDGDWWIYRTPLIPLRELKTLSGAQIYTSDKTPKLGVLKFNKELCNSFQVHPDNM